MTNVVADGSPVLVGNVMPVVALPVLPAPAPVKVGAIAALIVEEAGVPSFM